MEIGIGSFDALMLKPNKWENKRQIEATCTFHHKSSSTNERGLLSFLTHTAQKQKKKKIPFIASCPFEILQDENVDPKFHN